MKLRLYGLLHLCEKESSAENFSAEDFRDQIAVYVNCAMNLSNTLQSQGIAFTLLTNKKDAIEDILQSERKNLAVKEILFSANVPPGIPFYSAHFKMDAFRYLSTLNDDYVGLCDLDMICIRNLPLCLSNNIQQQIPMYYDISDQVIPAYGHEAIIRDLQLIHGLESEGRWSGGEYLSGTPMFFQTLTNEIDGMYMNYINNMENLHHIGGEETITSAALEKMRRKGIAMADAGTLGIVGRFWNADTLHPQKPFQYFKQCFLLHLPADKRFLADMATKKNGALSTFETCYTNYRKSFAFKFKKLIRQIVNMLMK